MSGRVVLPKAHQPELPVERLVARSVPGPDAVAMDVVFVGAGPAGLSGAIELARLSRAEVERGGPLGGLQIAVLEKASALGGHTLSGASINPRTLREMFPDEKDWPAGLRGAGERVYWLTRGRAWRVPTPPTIQNRGNLVTSLGEVVRWLGAKAEELGVNVLVGYPAAALLVEGERVVGVRTAESGLGRDGQPGPNHAPGTDITAKFVALTEGTRGALTEAWKTWKRAHGENPQTYALGVKELWEAPAAKELTGPEGATLLHTMGWPIPRGVFGGTFVYPMGDGLLALGMVAGLDTRVADLDVHDLLQRFKTHPFMRRLLEGGRMIEWGAKTIPEGGYWALPSRWGSEGVVVCGDSAGLVEVAALKGVHYAMESGRLAARAIFEALRRGAADASETYGRSMRESFIWRDLRERRNVRLAFRSGLVSGAVKAGLMVASRGRLLGGRIATEEDAAIERRVWSLGPPPTPDGKLTFSKVDAVGRSDNTTRDDVPSHLLAADGAPPAAAAMYARMCPAGVYEEREGRLVVNAPNCVDCKATDILGPRWLPREGGSGPNYKRM